MQRIKGFVVSTLFASACMVCAGTTSVQQLANTPYNDELSENSSGVYRIPAMAKSTNGVIVAVSDCRNNSSADLPNSIDIAEVWSGDNGVNWSTPLKGIDVENTNNYVKVCNIGDPCMLYDPVGDKFWLMAITGGGLASSHDGNGKSIADVVLYTRGTGENDAWQEWAGGPEGNRRSVKQMILDSLAEVDSSASSDENQIRGILQGPGHGIVQRQAVYAGDGETVLMPKDALVFPMQYFRSKSSFSDSFAFAVYSTDGGVTWKSTKLAPTQKAQESCIMELDDGSWVMMAKCSSGGERYFFRTTDYLNWTKHDSLSPSAACQGSCLWLGKGADGKSRYVSCFAANGDRSNITLHFGTDNSADKMGLGIMWGRSYDRVIQGSTSGLFAYNSLVMVDGDTLGTLLEVGGHLTFRTEDIGAILENDIAAVIPVAVWDGDFGVDALTNFTSNGYTLVDWNETHGQHDSSVTIDRANQGLMFNSDTPMSGLTVLVRYSGLEASESAKRVLFASCVTSNHKYDRTGVQLNPSGTLVGLWNSSTSSGNDADNGTASGSIPSSGVMAFTYSTAGTYLYYGVVSSMISPSAVWGSSALKTSYDTSIYGAAIGGMCDGSAKSDAEAAKGMTINAVAVFDCVLTAEQMRAYKWETTAFVNAAEDINVSTINASLGSNTEMVLTVADGVVVHVDEPFASVPVWVVCDGSLTLSAESQPAASHFATVDFSCVKGAVKRTWIEPGTVGFNFYADNGNDTSGALVSGMWFSNRTDRAGSSSEMFSDGLSTLSWSSSTLYNYSSGTMVNGYLDDGENGGSGAAVSLSNVPYDSYDIVIYCATDTGSASFSAKTVNGRTYTWDIATGTVLEGTGSWGKSRHPAATYGLNALRIDGLSGPLSIYGNVKNGSVRGGIAAVQIMPHATPDRVARTHLTLDGGNVSWSAAKWKAGDEDASAPVSGEVEITLAGSTTLTLDAGVWLDLLTVTGVPGAVLTMESGEGSSFTSVVVRVNGGVLRQGSDGIFSGASSVVVNEGATFDLNGRTFGKSTTLYLSGAGAGSYPWALTSSGGNFAAGSLAEVVLLADATVGGARNITFGTEYLDVSHIDFRGHKLTKIGSGTLTLLTCRNVVNGTGAIDIVDGTVATSGYTCLDGYETDYANTTVVVRKGATFRNGANGRFLWVHRLGQEAGGTIDTSSQPFAVESEFAGSGTTSKLRFASGALATLTGDLTIVGELKLGGKGEDSGSVSFARSQNLSVPVTVAIAGTFASEGSVSVGEGVILNLGTNRPPATLSFAADAGLVVKLMAGESAVSLNAASLPSTFTLFDFDGSRVVNAKATFVDGTLSIAPHVAPESISINFHNGSELDSTGAAKLGIAGFRVPQDQWNSLIATNNATLSKLKCVQSNGGEITRRSMSVTVTGTRGSYQCSGLSSGSNILHGYIDDHDSYATPTVTVAGVPYDKYRVVVYHSTDTKNISFGYDLVNDIPFTGVSGHTSVGTMRWGDTGPSNSANAIEEGVNTLVTPILSNNAGKTLTVTGHRISGTVARGCIAAIQIFDASDEEEELDAATNRVSSTYADGTWSFPDDMTVADPSGFGGMIIGTNAVSQSLGSSKAKTISASVLAAIPETSTGTLISFGVDGGNSVHARYNGDGTFLLHFNNDTTASAVKTTKAVDVLGVHIWTLAFDADNGASFYRDGKKVADAPSIKWTSGGAKKISGSVEFGARHDQKNPLTRAIVYAARTDFSNAKANNLEQLFATYENIPAIGAATTVSEAREIFSHAVGYGDIDALLALMPHRTSTYEYGAWHCPLDAKLADGDYVEGLEISRYPVEYNLVDVTTNAICASVLAKIAAPGKVGTLVSFFVNNGARIDAVYNGDGRCYIRWGDGSGYDRAWTEVLDVSGVHVWSLVYCNDGTSGTALYCDGNVVASDNELHWSGNDGRVKGNVCLGAAANDARPMQALEIYAVHVDFASDESMFNRIKESASHVFDTFDFIDETIGDEFADKIEAFARYAETGVAKEPEPIFDPEADEVAEECVLRISEIMPKPTDAQDRGKLEGMDVNGLESGWVEVENTSDKWADLKDYRFIRVNRGKKTDPAGVGNFPSRLVPPHGRAIIYTSERYSNSKDKKVSAFAEGTFDGKPMIFADYGNILVWGDKVNPKKSPYVRLYYAPGGDSDKGTVVDTVVIPSDLPEGWSIIVGDAAEDEGTRRWMCPTPTRGKANTATDGLRRIGPNVGPLYEKKGQKKTDHANEFAAITPPALPGTDYTVTLPINAVMNPDGTFTPRAADRIASLKFVYRKDLDDTTLVTNVIEMATKNTVENWGDQYTATIPASYFPAAGHLMQWKVLITDGEGVEWTSPSFNNKDDGYEWYGTIVEPGELNSATLPTWHMFASGKHLTQMDYDKDDSRYTLENGARIAIYDASTSNYYDYVRIDLRGHTSANFTKKGHGLRFAKAHPLTMVDSVTGETIEEIRKTSLISEFADPSYMRQMIAFWLWRKMGNLVPFDFPVRCNLNGEFYQLAFNSERFTDELIEDVYGLDKFGYGYKNVGTLNKFTTAGGTEKKTPDDENETDLSVLRNQIETPLMNLGANTAHATAESTNITKFVVEKFDLPAWVNYLASARITQEMDDVWANVCAYYDNPDMKEGTRGTGTWMPLGYDFNVSLGQFYVESGMTATGLSSTNDWFKSHPLYGGWTVKTGSNGNNGFEAVLQSPKFRRLFLRRLRTLMDQELKEPGVSSNEVPFMVEMRKMADLMRDDVALDHDKWPNNGTDNAIDVWAAITRPATMDAGIDDIWDNYVVPRRVHLYVTHSVTNTAKEIGYGSNLNAGIPEAQSPIEMLAPNISISNLTALDAAEAEALGVAGQLYDTEVVVIRNDNDEVVDMSGWRLAFSVDFTFPAGTVCDANDSIYIVADRRAYIDAHDAELTDQVIVGNAAFTGAGPVALYDADGALVYSAIPQTDELKYLRLHSFYGNTLDGDGDAGEWFTLTNISDTVTLDLVGVTVCFLKQGDPEEGTAHCHVTLENKKGSIASLKSWTAQQADYSDKGWEKIQNNKQLITIYDKYGSVCQSLKVTQKSFPLAYGKGGYLVCDSIDASVTKDSQWHEALPNNGESSESFDADSQEAANELIAKAKPALSDDDVDAGLEPQYLKIVALPVEGEVGKYKAVVVVNPDTVEVPVMAQIEEGEATVDPLTVESDEEGSKVTVGVSNATVGLWYGFIWTDSLGDKPFENDVESFKRATSTSVKIESKAEAAKSAQKAFFRVKVSATKP